MQIGSDTRESAFRVRDYADQVIKIEIRGNTVDEIDMVAQAAGLTATQWIRVTIAAELLKSQPEKLIKRPCQDPTCWVAWADHEEHVD